MTLHVEFRPATPADADALRTFLSAAGLPEDVDPSRQEFLLATQGDAIVGSAALEVRRGDALLRSLAVAPALRGQGLGDALLERMIAHARAIHVDTVWLLVESAQPWFEKRGFAAVDRAAAPPALASSSQFRSAACAAARLLRRSLDG
jgi:N-acetylglutamate synthase-like GNAT family acetyltransferase